MFIYKMKIKLSGNNAAANVAKMKRLSVIAGFFCIALNGCMVRPSGAFTPLVDVPKEWSESSVESRSHAPHIGDWWKVLDDEVLNDLEMLAITNNQDVYAAFYRVVQARANAGASLANLYPQITFQPKYEAFQGLITVPLPKSTSNEDSDKIIPLTNIYGRDVIKNYTLPFDISYELDLWGKLAYSKDVAFQNAEAVHEAWKTMLLSVTVEIAIQYYHLRAIDQSILLLKNMMHTRAEELAIIKDRFNSGLIFYADVSQAEQLWAMSAAQMPQLQSERKQAQNAIAVLTGSPPSVFYLAENPLEGEPPPIPAGLPSELLLRRPDIAESEHLVAAEYAQIGVATASFFPSLTFDTRLGMVSPLADLLFAWKAKSWLIAVEAVQTIFDGGKKSANLLASQAKYYETIAIYQQKVLKAFRETEDALTNLKRKREEKAIVKIRKEAARETKELSLDRYLHGLAPYLEVTESEKTLLQAQTDEIRLLEEEYMATFQLIKSLGGSWNSE